MGLFSKKMTISSYEDKCYNMVMYLLLTFRKRVKYMILSGLIQVIH